MGNAHRELFGTSHREQRKTGDGCRDTVFVRSSIGQAWHDEQPMVQRRGDHAIRHHLIARHVGLCGTLKSQKMKIFAK